MRTRSWQLHVHTRIERLAVRVKRAPPCASGGVPWCDSGLVDPASLYSGGLHGFPGAGHDRTCHGPGRRGPCSRRPRDRRRPVCRHALGTAARHRGMGTDGGVSYDTPRCSFESRRSEQCVAPNETPLDGRRTYSHPESWKYILLPSLPSVAPPCLHAPSPPLNARWSQKSGVSRLERRNHAQQNGQVGRPTDSRIRA